jgi:formiminotetrahydrofolate cyclodeaminase
MNMTDYRVTGMWKVFEKINRMAKAMGIPIKESEIIGLIPQQAINNAFVDSFKIANFHEDQIIEKKLDRIKKDPLLSPYPFLEILASSAPAPGGGSCAALSGAIAAALGAMVARLTIGKKKYKAYEGELVSMIEKLDNYRKDLFMSVKSDSEAFERIIEAKKLPKETDEEKKVRQAEIQKATVIATESPLSVMDKSLEVMKLLEILVSKGTRNAISDTGGGIAHARSAITSAFLNVKINVGGIEDSKRRTEIENRAEKITQEADKIYKRAFDNITAYQDEE